MPILKCVNSLSIQPSGGKQRTSFRLPQRQRKAMVKKRDKIHLSSCVLCNELNVEFDALRSSHRAKLPPAVSMSECPSPVKKFLQRCCDKCDDFEKEHGSGLRGVLQLFETNTLSTFCKNGQLCLSNRTEVNRERKHQLPEVSLC